MQRADGELIAGDYRDLTAPRAVPLAAWAGLAGVMALGLGLRLWRLGQNGYGTEYYSAGVRSMMDSPHNFLFNSFDPAGFVSLDKPPVALWIQVASVKLLGFSGLAVLLPQVLEGLACIALVYWLVARRFGEGAGLLAALFQAVTPISVVIDRSSNTDSCLVLVLLLAAWALSVATERGSGALLALAMALVGVGFNVKMLAAFVVLPTFALLYVAAAPLPWPRRLAHLLVGGAVLLVVSLSWVVFYDLTPTERRPFAGSSRSNSMIELAVGHNSVERFVRRRGMFARGPRDNAAVAQGQPGAAAGPAVNRWRRLDNVPVGPLRLADRHLAGQMAWLLPLAVAGAAVLAVRRERRRWPLGRDEQALVLWAGWALTYAVVYSVAGGIFHAYYLVTMAPPLAALAAIGVMRLWSRYREGGRVAPLLPATLAITAAWQLFIWYADLPRTEPWRDWRVWLCLAMLAGAHGASASLLVALGRRVSRPSPRLVVALGIALTALLATPLAWSLGAGFARTNVMLPYAALPGAAARDDPPVWQGGNRVGRDARLLAFLRANHHGERYLLATLNSRLAAPVIIETGLPVMAIGGFMGADPILTPEQFAALAATGTVRFVLLGGDFARRAGGESPQRPIVDWIKTNGAIVDPTLWRSTRGRTERPERLAPPELYDLHRSAGLAPAGTG
jgi:4-amino-4-deoxy-L-arabinose transferase-like glycosyltransferase